jgi:hypothetical protein
MGQADIALRHVTRQHPEDLARGLLPPGLSFEVAGWIDTQVTALERRLDKALELRVAGERRLLHVEIELDLGGEDAHRVFEYNALLVMALHAETPRALRKPRPRPSADDEGSTPTKSTAPVPVLSVVIVLRGRREPWPAEAAYGTSWPDVPFSGAHFRVEAVYQRTMAELRARGSLLWLVFTPLAVDADAAAMREVLAEIRERILAAEGRADLYAALLVMAEIDPWGHNLKEEIMTMMQADDLEILKLSPTLRGAFEEGAAKGAEEEREKVLSDAFAEQAGRAPTPDEQAALAKRARELGSTQALRTVFKLHGGALADWLLGNGGAPERAG